VAGKESSEEAIVKSEARTMLQLNEDIRIDKESSALHAENQLAISPGKLDRN
jgi:hypothetical protein